MKSTILIVAISFCFLSNFCFAQQTYLPVVIVHGLANDSSSMSDVVLWIQNAMPGIYVKNLEIGDGYWDSFFMSLNTQVWKILFAFLFF